MDTGDVVRIRVFGGRVVDRVVIEKRETVVVACNPDEYKQAAQEGRKPQGIGFPLEDVLGLANSSSEAENIWPESNPRASGD